MSTPNPHHGQDAAVLLSRTYVFAAFGGRWPDVAFLILALSDTLGGLSLGPSASWQIHVTATPELDFPPGYLLECLHGRDRVRAAARVLPPGISGGRWTVDLYLAGTSSLFLHATRILMFTLL
jgi:hypothetical protein